MGMDIGPVLGLDGVPLLVAVLMSLLTPVVVSLLKARNAPPAIQANLFWLVCLAAAGISVSVSAIQDPANRDSAGGLLLDFGKMLIPIAILAQTIYKAFWKPSGLDEKVAEKAGAKIGDQPLPPPPVEEHIHAPGDIVPPVAPAPPTPFMDTPRE